MAKFTIKFLVIGFFLSYPVFSFGGEYRLMLSEANNYYDKGEIHLAVEQYKSLIETYPKAADCHLQLGLIYWQKNMNKIALHHLEKAKDLEAHLIHDSEKVEMHMHLAAVYHRLKYKSLEMQSLEQVIELSREKNTSYYRQNRGRAYYLKAIAHSESGETFEANESWERSAENDYRARSAYLHLAYFYASRSQDEIDRVYQARDMLRTRLNAFEFYYRRYLDSEESLLEKESLASDAMENKRISCEDFLLSRPELQKRSWYIKLQEEVIP